MPLTVNVGLSKKTSENYNSQGVSINISAELDQGLLSRPDELRHQIGALYEQAEQSLERQAGPPAPPPARDNSDRYERRDNGGNGSRRNNGNGASHDQQPRGMSQSQRRAIHAIANRLGIDPAEESHHEFGFDLGKMTVREASQFIDHLKTLQGAHAGNGGGR